MLVMLRPLWCVQCVLCIQQHSDHILLSDGYDGTKEPREEGGGRRGGGGATLVIGKFNCHLCSCCYYSALTAEHAAGGNSHSDKVCWKYYNFRGARKKS